MAEEADATVEISEDKAEEKDVTSDFSDVEEKASGKLFS